MENSTEIQDLQDDVITFRIDGKNLYKRYLDRDLRETKRTMSNLHCIVNQPPLNPELLQPRSKFPPIKLKANTEALKTLNHRAESFIKCLEMLKK